MRLQFHVIGASVGTLHSGIAVEAEVSFRVQLVVNGDCIARYRLLGPVILLAAAVLRDRDLRANRSNRQCSGRRRDLVAFGHVFFAVHNLVAVRDGVVSFRRIRHTRYAACRAGCQSIALRQCALYIYRVIGMRVPVVRPALACRFNGHRPLLIIHRHHILIFPDGNGCRRVSPDHGSILTVQAYIRHGRGIDHGAKCRCACFILRHLGGCSLQVVVDGVRALRYRCCMVHGLVIAMEGPVDNSDLSICLRICRVEILIRSNLVPHNHPDILGGKVGYSRIAGVHIAGIFICNSVLFDYVAAEIIVLESLGISVSFARQVRLVRVLVGVCRSGCDIFRFQPIPGTVPFDIPIGQNHVVKRFGFSAFIQRDHIIPMESAVGVFTADPGTVVTGNQQSRLQRLSVRFNLVELDNIIVFITEPVFLRLHHGLAEFLVIRGRMIRVFHAVNDKHLRELVGSSLIIFCGKSRRLLIV